MRLIKRDEYSVDLSSDCCVNASCAVVPRLNGSQSVETVSVAVGGTVVLDCSVIEGVPDPVVRWHRNGSPLSLQAEPNVRTEEEGGGQRLVVFGVQLMDSGVYSCVAANEAGSSSKDFLLNVLGKH